MRKRRIWQLKEEAWRPTGRGGFAYVETSKDDRRCRLTQWCRLMRPVQIQLRCRPPQSSLVDKKYPAWRRAHVSIDNRSDVGFGVPIPSACQRRGNRGDGPSSRPMPIINRRRRRRRSERARKRPSERDSIILKAFPVDALTHICVDWASCCCCCCCWQKPDVVLSCRSRRRYNLHVYTTHELVLHDR